MTTTAKINAATGAGAGIAPDLAKTLHDQLGKTITAVVSLRSESRGENLKGDETVNLAITDLVVIPDDLGAAEHVREIAHVIKYNRKLAENGPTLPLEGDSPEPKVEEVLAAGARHRPHPYLASTLSVDDSDTGPVCDVCGLLETAPLHSTQDTLPDPFAIPDQDDEDEDDDPVEFDERPVGGALVRHAHVHVAGKCIKNRNGALCDVGTADPDDPSYEPHDYIDDGQGACIECDQAEDAAVHTTNPDPDPAA